MKARASVVTRRKHHPLGLMTLLMTAVLLIPPSRGGLHAAGQEERIIRFRPATRSYLVRFNGETIRAYCRVFDVRTEQEREKNRRENRLGGNVIVFFHGHAQRPDDGNNLLEELALRSKSGILVIPVCDTPYGRDAKWRGDSGKVVILRDLVRLVLHERGVTLEGYGYDPALKTVIDGAEVFERPWEKWIITRATVMGWSHGCLLARRFASAYPDTVREMAQMSPAGYVNWGGENFCGPSCLMGRFAWECGNIGTGVFSHPGDVFGSGWGVAKGMTGDTARSCGSCIGGNKSCMKPFRNFRDTKDCALYGDDSNLPVPNLERIVILFGKDDTLFNAGKILGAKDPKKITEAEKKKFWEKFYAKTFPGARRLLLEVYPGDHIGPLVYYKKYAETALKETGQYR